MSVFYVWAQKLIIKKSKWRAESKKNLIIQLIRFHCSAETDLPLMKFSLIQLPQSSLPLSLHPLFHPNGAFSLHLFIFSTQTAAYASRVRWIEMPLILYLTSCDTFTHCSIIRTHSIIQCVLLSDDRDIKCVMSRLCRPPPTFNIVQTISRTHS